MKALTLKQPWATLVVRGVKRFETRSWAYRPIDWVEESGGRERPYFRASTLPIRLAIHASASFAGEDLAFARWLRDVVGCLDTEDLPTGAIVGTVRYVAWHWSYPEIRAELAPSPLELELGDWSDHRLLWQFEDPVELEEPIAIRGAQRIWNWLAPEYDERIRALARGFTLPCPVCDHADGHHDDYAHAAAAVTG